MWTRKLNFYFIFISSCQVKRVVHFVLYDSLVRSWSVVTGAQTKFEIEHQCDVITFQPYRQLWYGEMLCT